MSCEEINWHAQEAYYSERKHTWILDLWTSRSFHFIQSLPSKESPLSLSRVWRGHLGNFLAFIFDSFWIPSLLKTWNLRPSALRTGLSSSINEARILMTKRQSEAPPVEHTHFPSLAHSLSSLLGRTKLEQVFLWEQAFSTGTMEGLSPLRHVYQTFMELSLMWGPRTQKNGFLWPCQMALTAFLSLARPWRGKSQTWVMVHTTIIPSEWGAS